MADPQQLAVDPNLPIFVKFLLSHRPAGGPAPNSQKCEEGAKPEQARPVQLQILAATHKQLPLAEADERILPAKLLGQERQLTARAGHGLPGLHGPALRSHLARRLPPR